MTTNVPSASLGPTGFVAPAESDILTGTQADLNAAFAGNLNPALNTPQGQIATSLAAIIGDANDQFLALANGVDPAFADGRMQDAIARIYFIERIGAQSTVVTGTCSGLTGTLIPIGAQAVDAAGNRYLSTASGVIPAGGSVDLPFACLTTGAIACPIGYLNGIYQAIPGWDSVTNSAAGVLGNDVESRANFEYRRQQSVALNSQGSLASVRAAVLAVPGVLDAYCAENKTGTMTGAVFTGWILGNTLTVTAMTSGTINVGDIIGGTSVVGGSAIQTLGSGTGGTGTYLLNISQTVASSGSPEAMTSAPGGFPLIPHSIFVCAYGGSAAAIAQAIYTKKSPGCDMNGNTTTTVTDSVNYVPPYPAYAITYEVPATASIKFAVSMQSNVAVPSNAIDLVCAAIVAAFNGSDGGSRARIGSYIFASRFYAGVASLGTWALVYSIQVGIGTANQPSVLIGMAQVPTLASTDIAVTFS